MPGLGLLRGAAIIGALVVIALAPAVAQTAPTPGPSATPAPWTLNGYFDTTYTNPGAQGGTFMFTNGNFARVFDFDPHRFVFNNFTYNLKKNTTNGIGGQLEIIIGSDANVIRPLDGGGPYSDITQANVYYAHGPLTFTVGKFVTLAGAEVIDTTADTETSRSILFGYAIPFTHTGARLNYVLNDKLNVTVGGNNGWDKIGSNGTGLTFEGQVAWTPTSKISLSSTLYTGQEHASGSTQPISPVKGTRTLLDLVGSYTLNKAWKAILNYDTAAQTNAFIFDSTGAPPPPPLSPFGNASWNGIAGYLVWTPVTGMTISGRLERFNDMNGYRTGFAQTWNEGTITLQSAISKRFSFREEFREDWSNQAVFAKAIKPVGVAVKRNNAIGLELLYTWP